MPQRVQMSPQHASRAKELMAQEAELALSLLHIEQERLSILLSHQEFCKQRDQFFRDIRTAYVKGDSDFTIFHESGEVEVLTV